MLLLLLLLTGRKTTVDNALDRLKEMEEQRKEEDEQAAFEAEAKQLYDNVGEADLGQLGGLKRQVSTVVQDSYGRDRRDPPEPESEPVPESETEPEPELVAPLPPGIVAEVIQ